MTRSSGFAERPTRVLFVDDDPLVLRSLHRALRADGGEFEHGFAADGPAALRHMEARPSDIVVSDMRMPGMDGRQLLGHVRDRYPDTVRIVLTGESNPRCVFRAVPVAHQFLAKPWRPPQLRATLARARALRRLLRDPEMRALVGESNDLPSAPRMYMRLVDLLSDPDASLSDVADVVEQDVAMSAKVVHLAASAYFGLPPSVRTARSAVTYLGAETLQVVVLAFEVFSELRPERCPEFDAACFQDHAILTGRLAREMLRGHPRAGEALLAGMLHDVGLLLLAARRPAVIGRVIRRARERGESLYEAELEVYGATHCALGAYLMGLWGLPEPVVEAAALHHTPRLAESDEFGVVAAVYAANVLATEPPTPDDGADPLDLEHLGRLGVADRISRWRALAGRLRRQHGARLRHRYERAKSA